MFQHLTRLSAHPFSAWIPSPLCSTQSTLGQFILWRSLPGSLLQLPPSYWQFISLSSDFALPLTLQSHTTPTISTCLLQCCIIISKLVPDEILSSHPLLDSLGMGRHWQSSASCLLWANTVVPEAHSHNTGIILSTPSAITHHTHSTTKVLDNLPNTAKEVIRKKSLRDNNNFFFFYKDTPDRKTQSAIAKNYSFPFVHTSHSPLSWGWILAGNWSMC